jgi:hypothetical protein
MWLSAICGLIEAGVGPNNSFTLDQASGTKIGGSTLIFRVNDIVQQLIRILNISVLYKQKNMYLV